MQQTLIRLIAATAVLCSVTTHAWAQAAAAAVPMPDLAPLYNEIPIDSVRTGESGTRRGVYALFAESGRARAALRAAGLSVGDDGLAYIGQTKNSFRERLARHFRGTSNLRTPLTRVLGPSTTTDVSQFIRRHFRVGLLPLDDPAQIDAVERRLIQTKNPPLNTVGNARAVITGATSRFSTLRLLGKGAAIGALIELPVTAIVGTLDVLNGRKTTQEAVTDGAKAMTTVAVVGAIAGGVASSGITIPGAVPLAVIGGAVYAWNAGSRIWEAVDGETKAAVEAGLAAAVEDGVEAATEAATGGFEAAASGFGAAAEIVDSGVEVAGEVVDGAVEAGTAAVRSGLEAAAAAISRFSAPAGCCRSGHSGRGCQR